jgi:sorbitol/mannitol transport system permease protein
MAPAVIPLLLWMIVPLVMTLYFSTMRYNLLDPTMVGFVGIDNYTYLLGDPSLATAVWNTVLLTGGVLLASVVLGVPLAVLLDQPFLGHKAARLLLISPFFVMPTVAALVWKNLLLHPVNGLLAWITRSLGLGAVDWFGQFPLFSVGVIVAWQWVPFAVLILVTALQSLDRDQVDAAKLDGAGPLATFVHITVPHLSRAIGMIVMIEAIFLLSIFAEILVTTSGGPGDASTTLPYLIYRTALLDFDVGGASTGGVFAIVLANIVAFFLIRSIARNLDR